MTKGKNRDIARRRLRRCLNNAPLINWVRRGIHRTWYGDGVHRNHFSDHPRKQDHYK